VSELGALKKINPVVVVLTLALLIVSNMVTWNPSLRLEHRALVFGLSLALVLVAVGFEAHRIARQEDLEKEAY
jgi:hypothetical protein